VPSRGEYAPQLGAISNKCGVPERQVFSTRVQPS